MQRLALLVLVAFSLILPGCGGGDGEGSEASEAPQIDCEKETVPTFAEVRAFDVCTNCHSSEKEGLERNGAPPNLNFDVYEIAADTAPRMVNQVSMGNMPPPSSGFSLTAEVKDELFVWAECGTPE